MYESKANILFFYIFISLKNYPNYKSSTEISRTELWAKGKLWAVSTPAMHYKVPSEIFKNLQQQLAISL